jgi:FtsP/CotA-like multicopper oxidase with cupredoxin domain
MVRLWDAWGSKISKLATATIIVAGVVNPACTPKTENRKTLQKITAADKNAAAGRAAALGMLPGVAGLPVAPAPGVPLPGMEGPGGVPHYFGPYGNWAFSPLPRGGVGAITVDVGGTGYTAPAVAIRDAYGTGDGTATATIDPLTQIAPATGAILGITVTNAGSGYSAPVIVITDATGVGAAATAQLTALVGGMRKFVDKVPGLTPAGANALGQYIPIAVPETKIVSGQTVDYYEIALVEFTERMHSDLPPTRLRGYVQLATAAVPGAGVALTLPGGAPILKPDGTPAIGVDSPHYMGPIIVAKGRAHGVASPDGDPRPVRIKFYNLLPAGAGGNLFLPVDESVMGSGTGPSMPGLAGDKYTQNRGVIHLHGNNTVWISDGTPHQWITPADEVTPYPKGVSMRNVPDMLDAGGNVDCEVAPAGKNSSGCQTFYYTNAQSARLQFYHDHSMGITRLNVYAGEAAGYVLTDAVEQDMINGTNVSGVNPGLLKVLPDIGTPLVIQDRTFVDAATVFAQDPTWNSGTGPRDPLTGNLTGAVTGDLWYPHVYMTAQNPWDLAGVNAFGRWHYGPWFNPPVPECVNGGPVGCIAMGPMMNEYHQADCDLVPPGPGCTAPWEPPMRPGVPSPSMAGEAFMDTPVVNGAAYPYLDVEPKAYRFRVLSGGDDRMLNLQLYVAADKTTPTTPGTLGTVLCDGTAVVPVENCTEVKMVPVGVAPANQYAQWPSGIPDPATKGPDWILIGTEGGFAPAPLVVPTQPVGWNLNPTTFNYGVVNQHSLLLGSAERADVVVDFSAYAGKTLVLYNDAPAAFPAGVPVYDYFTGVPSQLDVGGAPTTLPGYGPNTRTIMQIRVGATVTTPTTDVTLANLRAVWAKTPTKRGVFEATQPPIIVPQAAYDSAYASTFPATAAGQYVQIADTAKTFQPIDANGVLQPAVTIPLEMKAMHDEMGGVYDTMYGRMSGMLGLSNPLSPVHVLIPYGFASPPTDVARGSIEATPIGVMPDGTQIWRIFHNGVDTHTIHTHLFHTQVVNRVAQDGINLGVDPIELGWKDTFRVNPLEITYLALRPTVPSPDQLPFDVPDSVRLIDPTLPEGATLIPPSPAGWFNPAGVAIPEILNHYVNYGWEYMWHCHILAHEEMDMMHSLAVAVPPKTPTNLAGVVAGTVNNPIVNLTWMDNSIKEVQFTIQRASDPAFTTGMASFNFSNPTPTTTGLVTFQDRTAAPNSRYWYRVAAIGPPVGDLFTAGFPTMSADSVSNTVEVLVGAAPGVPTAPTNLAAVLAAGPMVRLTWLDNATNETAFSVERCAVVPPAIDCTNFARIAAPGARNNTGSVAYGDATVVFGTTYLYRVAALNGAGLSAYSPVPPATVSVSLPAIPPAPTGLTVAAVKAAGTSYTATLNWAAATNPASFTIQRAENLSFTTRPSTFTVTGTLRTLQQSVNRNTVYYYRIRANNGFGGFSAWATAMPFPIRTGP